MADEEPAADATVPDSTAPEAAEAETADAETTDDATPQAEELPPEEDKQEEAPPTEEEKGAAGEGPIAESSYEHITKVPSSQLAKRPTEASDQAKLLDTTDEKSEQRAKEVVGDVIDVRRDSFVDATGVPKVARFLNTYKMEPDKPYNPEKIIEILQEVMLEAFEAYTAFKVDEEGEITDIKYFLPYSPDLCAKQAKWASDTIRKKIKELEYRRYKLIIIVTMGEKHNQDIFCCCRFLWDFQKDNYTTYTMENPAVFGYALVFGLYYE